MDKHIIKQEVKYLTEVLGKKLIKSDERDNNKFGYISLAKKYWPEEFTDGERKDVHHIDFDHTNNIVSNLVVLTVSEHKQIHYLFDPSWKTFRKKLRDARIGKHHSEDVKQKIRIHHKGGTKGKHWKLIDGHRVYY